MILSFKPIKVWPEGWEQRRWGGKSSPFQSTYARTLAELDRELRHLGATAVTLQLDASETDLRLDGQLRANAVVKHPGVILTIETRKHGTLVYATRVFNHWQANLRAITLGLGDLRRVERYGIAERGQQYAGYREIGTGIALGPAQMTVEQAARILADCLGLPADEGDGYIGNPEAVRLAYARAAKAHHPDVGGDAEVFRTLTAARDLLLGVAS